MENADFRRSHIYAFNTTPVTLTPSLGDGGTPLAFTLVGPAHRIRINNTGTVFTLPRGVYQVTVNVNLNALTTNGLSILVDNVQLTNAQAGMPVVTNDAIQNLIAQIRVERDANISIVAVQSPTLGVAVAQTVNSAYITITRI
ncbi:MAG: hypothetical protein LBU60_01650 [Clostridiales bacterium]|jgi:hypothetical protein|nr:hypothetical protein [Clostridiales bacterium]